MHPRHQPDGMGEDRHREHMNMKEAHVQAEEPYLLRVTRPNPSVDMRVSEVWGHGTEEEMELFKAEKEAEYGDEYDFTISKA